MSIGGQAPSRRRPCVLYLVVFAKPCMALILDESKTEIRIVDKISS